jgi:glucoamylase
LTGERAHYELAAGRSQVAGKLLATLEGSANSGGLLPEQVWDKDDIPERELFRGRPSGGAMPLVWAHAEHIKLLRSLRDKRVFDMPPQPVQRYQIDKVASLVRAWRFNQKIRSIPPGKKLRIEVLAATRVHWTMDDWKTSREDDTHETAFGIHLIDLPTQPARHGTLIQFTFYWHEAGRWEGTDFAVLVQAMPGIATGVAGNETAEGGLS